MKDTPADIIADNGGPAAFAAKVGCRPGTVRAWKHRNQFPREAWPEIMQAFPALTLARLMEIEARLGADGKAVA